MRVDSRLKESDNLSRQEQSDLQKLRTAVYPPEEAAAWPGRDREWSSSEWSVLVYVQGFGLGSHTGALIREGRHEGRAVRVGGVGGVATHPDARRRGLAAAGIGSAVELFKRHGVGFALLVCEQGLIPYYQGLGWRLFEGTLLDRQWDEVEVFTFNEVMVLAVLDEAPTAGTIDLQGPAW